MKQFFKCYLDTWKKKDMDGVECLEMCWASVFILLGIAGVFILGCLIYKDW